MSVSAIADCTLGFWTTDQSPFHLTTHSPGHISKVCFQKALAFLFKELRRNELRAVEDLVRRAPCLTFQIDCGHASDTGTSQAPVIYPSLKLGLVSRDLDSGKKSALLSSFKAARKT